MSDQEDIDDLSRRLAKTDFSADSRIRASLRAKLLQKQHEGGAAARSLPARVAPLALAMTAAALLLLFPLRSMLHRASPASSVIQVQLPPAPLRAPEAAPRIPVPGKTVFPQDELGLPILPGRLIAAGASGEEPPISTVPVDRVIDIHRGRVTSGKNGNAVIWKTGDAAYILETRRISLDDLFETRTL